jgi:hypothetical protein
VARLQIIGAEPQLTPARLLLVAIGAIVTAPDSLSPAPDNPRLWISPRDEGRREGQGRRPSPSRLKSRRSAEKRRPVTPASKAALTQRTAPHEPAQSTFVPLELHAPNTRSGRTRLCFPESSVAMLGECRLDGERPWRSAPPQWLPLNWPARSGRADGSVAP